MRLQTPLLTTASTLAALAHAAAVPSAITTSEPLSDLIGEAAHNISARTINPAVRFTEYEGRQCGGWEAYYQAPDDGCYLLPTGDGFRIREIADSCRISVYASKNCDGAEFQAYPGNCYDVHAFYSIKAFRG